MGSSGAGACTSSKNGFLEELFNDGLEKDSK
jgi:hypothetical protein